MNSPQKHIIILEDDQDLLDLYTISLESAGFKVSGARDGYDGIELIEQGCDLILLDLMMPKADGKDVLSLLQMHEKARSIPIIILSNLSPDDIDLRQLDRQVLDFWVKAEVSPKTIVQRILEYFQQNS